MAKTWTKSILIDFSQFVLKKRHLVVKIWTKAPSGGKKLHFFKKKNALWWQKSELKRFFLKKRHLVVKIWTKAPSGGKNMHFFNKKKKKKRPLVAKKWTKAPSGGEKVN